MLDCITADAVDDVAASPSVAPMNRGHELPVCPSCKESALLGPELTVFFDLLLFTIGRTDLDNNGSLLSYRLLHILLYPVGPEVSKGSFVPHKAWSGAASENIQH